MDRDEGKIGLVLKTQPSGEAAGGQLKLTGLAFRKERKRIPSVDTRAMQWEAVGENSIRNKPGGSRPLVVYIR